jgi:hypothetical protein
MRVKTRVKYWEIIAENLSKAGWSWGCVSAIDSNGRTTWTADAHRDNGKRFVTHADEKLTAFLELGAAMRSKLWIIHDFRAPSKSCRLVFGKLFRAVSEKTTRRERLKIWLQR